MKFEREDSHNDRGFGLAIGRGWEDWYVMVHFWTRVWVLTW